MIKKFSPGDSVVVINSKLASFGRTGKVTQVVGAGAYVDHDGNGEENLYEPDSLAHGTELPFFQRPFESVILEKIEVRAISYVYRPGSREEVRFLGELLRASLIPEWRLEVVVKRLKEISSRLSHSHRQHHAESCGYLNRLASDLEGGFKWSGDGA